jgi:hypothetical protein
VAVANKVNDWHLTINFAAFEISPV